MPNAKHHKNQRNVQEAVDNEVVNNGERHVNNNHRERVEQHQEPPQQQQQLHHHHHQHDGDNAGRFQQCCVPTGCMDDPIDVTDPYDAVRVVCNNDGCTEGNWMHKECFKLWEQSVLSFLRSCGRARSWSEKQRLQNLWTKKGYDLAYKACDCKCSRGHLRKDLDYIPPPLNDNARKIRKNKKKNDKPMPVVSTNHKAGYNVGQHHHGQPVDNHNHHQQQQQQPVDNITKLQKKDPQVNNHPAVVNGTKRRGSDNTVNNNPSAKSTTANGNSVTTVARSRNNSVDQNDTNDNESISNIIIQNGIVSVAFSGGTSVLPSNGLRLRTNSVSSTGSAGSQGSSSGSIPSSAGSASPLSTSPVNGNIFLKGKKVDNFDTNHTGMFRHRHDFSAFSSLPRNKQNPYNIHIEDIQEDEDTRNFVLSNLTNKRMTALRCVLCKTQLPVFDRFPLVDGTLFLSPQAYDQFVVQVIWEGRIQFLNAVCINCLEGSSEAKCSSCKTLWDGTSFVVGTMYTYDIFAAMPCCQKRLTCKHCHRAVIDISVGLDYFSQYSRMVICPFCKANDYHFIRSLNDTFTIKESICGQC
ncbi:unnamed protein product [Candidula unifasciata]|uniref:Headcase middle domain-containing protein n=1 Tax=Candidula unifasciata TaxID=100452 RepID=A0A8S3ZHC9_9EUPU|nr:unnamed protein product [Candidula unifasciata]